MRLPGKLLCVLACAVFAGCGDGGRADFAMKAGPATTRALIVQGPESGLRVAGYRANYTIVRDAATGLVTLTDKIGGAVLALDRPAAIHFVDASVSFDVDGLAGRMYRLYQAAFDRRPDPAGLGFWIAAAEQGADPDAIAEGFVGSDEFRVLYGGGLAEDVFVAQLYRNILHRQPEQAGFDWWVAALAQGTTRGKVLNAFADSSENRAGVDSGIAGGFVYVPYRPGGPLLPLPTSYENKNAIAPGATALPGMYDPAMSAIRAAAEPGDIGFGERSLTFGDFNQDGTLAAFAAMTRFGNRYPADNRQRWPDSPARAYFMHRGAEGTWIDDTARRVPDPRDRMICVTPSYAITADFNSDGKPDVYVACTGIDFPVAGVWDDASEQHMFLSRPDGTYRHAVLPIGRIYGHQASAADIDGDGRVDIVTVDPKTNGVPFVLWGKGDGTFAQDTSRMPAAMRGKAIFGAMLVPVEGRLRLIVSGTTPGATAHGDPADYGTQVLSFRDNRFEPDIDLTPTLPLTSAGLKYSLATDHVYSGGYLYSVHVSADYGEQAVTRTDLRDGVTTMVFSSSGVDYTTALPQMFVGSEGFIGYFGIGCNAYDATASGKCAYRIAR